MLKLHKNYQIPLGIGCAMLCGVFLFQYLTFIPEYSHAVSTSTVPEDTRTLVDISTMQEMTPDICFNTDPGASKQLEDTRLNDDGKTRTYWVTKLPDGNCWMTQNLDYDDPGGTKVTDTSGSNGGPDSNSWENNNDLRQYWDPGEKVVSGSGLGNPGTDKHLLVGNYYSWLSVMSSNDGNKGNGTGTDGSICPAGWQLPTSNNTNNGSFAYLQTQGSIGSTGSKLNDTPYFFQYSGSVYSGYLSSAGSYGYYWSSTPNGTSYAYGLGFSSGIVNPSGNLTRYVGYPVRCVALAGRSVNDLNVSVTVKPVLTLEIKNKDVVIDPELNRINTGEFTAIVSSSTAYTLSLSSDTPALTNNTSTSDTTIPVITNTTTSATSKIEPGTNMWGIRTCNRTSSSTGVDDNSDVASEDCPTNPLTYADSKQATNPYLGIATNLTKYIESELGVFAEPTLFQVGIGIAPNLPAGTYQTNVTVTASQK